MKKGIFLALVAMFGVAFFFASCSKEDTKGCVCKEYYNGKYVGQDIIHQEDWEEIKREMNILKCSDYADWTNRMYKQEGYGDIKSECSSL